jgi:LSD1 subclass zinc finger protein
MSLATRITCPSCRTPLKEARGIRIGKKIACPTCRTAFIVRPEDAAQVEGAGGVSLSRLGIVLAGAALYLVLGAALAVFCFTHNHPSEQAAEAESVNEEQALDDGSDGTSAPPKAQAPPGQGTRSLDQQRRQRKIDDAIANGVWFLKGHAQPNGSWGAGHPVGLAALPGLTLLECGVPGSDPIIRKARDLVRREAVQVGRDPRGGIYQLALAILFLDRLGEYQDDDLIRYLALCLMAGQHPKQGAWHYQCPMLQRDKVPEMLQGLADSKQTLASWRKTALRGDNFVPTLWDNSNTQFAILALWVAQRHQVPIDKSIALVEKHFRDTQLKAEPGGLLTDPRGNNLNLDGSWPYSGNTSNWNNVSPWPSMTCSGLLGLAIAHGVSKDPARQQRKPLDDPGIQRGLAMLAREIDRPGERRLPDFYFLWSLERVGVLYDLAAIDGKDWYAWGCDLLLPRQQNDGSWRGGGYPGSTLVLDTCFALLFLKQANLAKDLTDKLQLLGSPAGSK